ncbi:MAG: glycosyltransferase family 2 protein [Rickettsiales bacterium]
MQLSVVIPLYNEEESVDALIQALEMSLGRLDAEFVFVDDGSRDGTVAKLTARMQSNWQLVVFRRNYGQTSAIAAGIAAARGDYIATMDGDLQNDPADIPLMLEKLKAEQVDVVVGWRQKRKDGMVLRKIPSKIANRLIRKLSGVYVHDYGCTLKVFTRDTAKELDLYGELHRFIPILATVSGAKIVEMPVRHHARQFGVSKYGIMRTFRVISDLLLMFFFQKYRQKPMHLFGSLGFTSFSLGSLILGYLFVLKLMGESIGTRPLFYIGILLWITAVQLVTTGFIAELVMRTYFESQQKKPYRVCEHLIGNTIMSRAA